MGLFDWFFGTPTNLTHRPDRVWMSAGDLRGGFAAMVRGLERPSALTLVSAHFPSLIAEVRELFQGTLVEVQQASDWDSARQPARPLLVSSDVLSKIARPVLPLGIQELNIFVYGRHFLSEKDAVIEAFGEKFNCPGEISFHVSLDDPLLRIFATDWVRDFLRNSSSGQQPWLESKMVSNSIKKAQQRMLEKTISKFDTASPEEWLKKNVQQ